MNTKRLRSNKSRSIAPVISFFFTNSAEPAVADIQTLTTALKTKLKSQQLKWNGNVLCRADSNILIIYNVKIQKMVKYFQCPFVPCTTTRFGKSFIITNLSGDAVYLLDFELNYKKVYSGKNIICCIPLTNNTFIIATRKRIILLNEHWRKIKSTQIQKIRDIIQLTDGRLAGLHGEKNNQNLHFTIWDATCKLVSSTQVPPSDDIFKLVQLSKNQVSAYGFAKSWLFDLPTLNSTRGAKGTLVAKLANGMHVVMNCPTLKVFDGDILIREIENCYPYSTWRNSVAEVSHGVVAWQQDHTLMCYNILNGAHVEGYPKPLCTAVLLEYLLE